MISLLNKLYNEEVHQSGDKKRQLCLTIIAANSNKVSLCHKVHDMAISRPWTLSLNNNSKVQNSDNQVIRPTKYRG